MIAPFNVASTPSLHFGAGKISVLPSVVKAYGENVLLVTGAKSFLQSPSYAVLEERFREQKNSVKLAIIEKEPSPAIIDSIVQQNQSKMPHVVVAIGGGSVLDAGKAISAMLPLNEPVKSYLEGVGTKSHPGKKIPFIAVATTAGTGSEATKNAVISETGENGYKKSLRHNNFVPDIALLDPELTRNCPAAVTAASGMDAFTQLLESYLSTMANPMTDALALEGLKKISQSLTTAYHDGQNLAARADLLLAAYLSGITLANAGLGLVHGFASALGGFYEIPHGVVCSTLMPEANRLTVQKLRKQNPNGEALRKYAIVGKLFSRTDGKSDDYYTDQLLETITSFAAEMKIPGLKKFGIEPNAFQKIINASDNKYNPVTLDHEEMALVLERSL